MLCNTALYSNFKLCRLLYFVVDATDAKAHCMLLLLHVVLCGMLHCSDADAVCVLTYLVLVLTGALTHRSSAHPHPSHIISSRPVNKSPSREEDIHIIYFYVSRDIIESSKGRRICSIRRACHWNCWSRYMAGDLSFSSLSLRAPHMLCFYDVWSVRTNITM